ncbi:hypothetical protein [Reichenbachiella ulvae]|uniref:Uncharacterized protein n=1 Tax=Reichenbachiella ulvae TaxID=2980104 RepID=A0ABT3CTW3_9BACT|nr:hypothetical protein [Reichenbachiella ulvae]MCV9386993.1 hypothetical protein [Reichenbachiella ulvae]
MNEKHIYLALLKVKNNTSVNELIHHDLNYDEIINLIKYVMTEKYITETEDSLILSAKGLQTLIRLEKTYKKTNKKDWIKPDERSIIKKIKKNDIFVPSSNELTFKLKFKE